MNPDKKIYLDYNSTTPVDPGVLEEMLPYFTEKFGNASSISHAFGWEAEEAVDIAREQIANLIGASATEITFTSGATEAINIALRGLSKAHRDNGNHIITCATEHKAVLDTCESLEQEGFEVTYLPVDESGMINLNELHSAIRNETILVTLMHANNEIATIHPLKEISKITRENSIPLMSDATQSVGKIPVDVKDLGVDIMTFSSHKMYGPKGAGALYLNKDNKPDISPFITGGGQEKGVRPGTLNVPAIVGFGKACELCSNKMEEDSERLSLLREKLEKELLEMDGVELNGTAENRLPYMTNISFQNIDNTYMIRRLKNLAVSQGSACTSSTHKPSHVLKAIGLSNELALSSIRIGLGRFTTEEEIKTAISTIKEVIPRLKLSMQ
ncbi:cysteine desulfurase family protein [Rhodohalobacter sulfatireducens]|uniref:cysteine desulfurase n=1 Tax=Rhodohalobacter sulfatireducens TaxID=2911366 RepID=A0ABS9K8U4_9BACT|nr:cysteine desulfurase family protein [Rhodohalobacter sulfatireducens]MCG2587282.1 cysteine desulfurase [Rhodohalobacter sulfatireducens]